MAKTQGDKSPQLEHCISRPEDSRFVALREDYRLLCVLVNGGTGDRVASEKKPLPSGRTKNESFGIDGRASKNVLDCATALLYYFERWTDMKIAAAKVSKKGLADLWIYGMSAKRIHSDLMGFFEVTTIRRSLDWLVDSGLLLRRTNQSDKLDKAFQYRFRTKEIQLILDALLLGTAHSLDLSHVLLSEHGSVLGSTSMFTQVQTQKSSSIDSSKELHGSGSKDPLIADPSDRPSSSNQKLNHQEKNPLDSLDFIQKADQEKELIRFPRTGKYKLPGLLALRSLQVCLSCRELDVRLAEKDGIYYGIDPKSYDAEETEFFTKVMPITKIVDLIGWQNGSPDYAAMNQELLGWFKYWCDRLKDKKVAKGDRISVIPVVAEFEGIEIEEWDDDEF